MAKVVLPNGNDGRNVAAPDFLLDSDVSICPCKVGDFEKAISDYEAALRLDPRSSFALYNCGIARDRCGDYDGAIADFTAAIDLDPDSNADFHHNRGFSLRKQVTSVGADSNKYLGGRDCVALHHELCST